MRQVLAVGAEDGNADEIAFIAGLTISDDQLLPTLERPISEAIAIRAECQGLGSDGIIFFTRLAIPHNDNFRPFPGGIRHMQPVGAEGECSLCNCVISRSRLSVDDNTGMLIAVRNVRKMTPVPTVNG